MGWGYVRYAFECHFVSVCAGFGDDSYRISFQRSGDVTATTLTIPAVLRDAPHVFETVLSFRDGAMQYQLRTSLPDPVLYRQDAVDSPEWLAVPPPYMTFRPRHPVRVACKVFVPHERDGFRFTNELTMFRAIPRAGRNATANMFFQEVIGQYDAVTQRHITVCVCGLCVCGPDKKRKSASMVTTLHT